MRGAEMQTQPKLTASEIIRLAGDNAADKIDEILALDATAKELEEALAWLRGDGDILARQGHPLGGKAAALFEILQADEVDEEP
jgi:hypothetical protein